MNRWLSPLIVLLLLLGWEAAVHIRGVKDFVLPAPSAVGRALVAHAPSLVDALWFTARITWAALLIAVVSGILLALLIQRSRVAEAGILPIAVALQVTPVIAISPIIIQWTGIEHPGRALLIVAWIVAFFPVVTATLTGLNTIPREQRDLFRLYGAGPLRTLVKLDAPASFPAVLGGIKVASGLALIGAVVAEFVVGTGTSQGLAWVLIQAIYMLDMPKAFACLALITGLGLIQYGLLALAERAVLRGRGLG
jgi:NitT/TauT family transport system permease protein